MEEVMSTPFRVEEVLPFLDPLISEWFDSKYSGLSDPQQKAIPLIHKGESVLVSSPTGTGKTLSAFLAILNELFIQAREGKLIDSVFCLYISPLKALANDINRNLKEPLEEIYELARSRGHEFPLIKVGVRSGDTPQSERQKMLRNPPHILITTPESLSLTLTSPKFRENLRSIKYVIIDEIHEVSSNKRGSLLSANLERLEEITGDVVRVGLSATQAPLDLIAKYLCGFDDGSPRPCTIIETDTKKSLDLKVLTPVEDLTKVSYEVANEKMYDILTRLIREHQTTLIFTNTRSSTEHVAIRLKARGIESIEAHHSSLGKETRLDVENRLKNGELKCVITSTSLELGIDIGYIDLVIQIGSPKSVSKGMQRIGRSGHGLDILSKGRFVVFELDDLVECAVLTKAAYDKEIDKVTIPKNSLDVLSQVLVGMSLEKAWDVEEAYKVVRRSYAYHSLDFDEYMDTLRYLSGKIEDQTIYSKIWLDEEEGRFGKKRSSRMIFFMNVGTIPEEADYRVINESGRHLGQLSDKFVERLKPGDVFVLGAKVYMFLTTRKNRVIVKDASGMRPTVPSWTGELLPRSYDLGVLVGKFRKQVAEKIEKNEDVENWLMEEYRLERSGAISIASYIKAQMSFGLPTNDHLFVEGYADNAKLYNTIYHVCLGRRVNDALSRAVAQSISNAFSINTRLTITDDGFMITTNQRVPIKDQLELIKKNDFREMVKRSISNTEVFKQRFRHCATRALMVLRKYKGYDITVARQQLRSDKVLRVLGKMESFPVIKEAFHEILDDMMDVERAERYVDEVISKNRYDILDYRQESSPFSYGLILAGISDIVLMEDRSKLLRELQGKILDRIYSQDALTFRFKDSKKVDDYFVNRIPRINDPADVTSFIDHFLFVDPLRNRYNSPFPYSGIDPKEQIEKEIEEDHLVSLHLRNPQWTSRNYYRILRSIFPSTISLESGDEDILSASDGKSMREIRRATGIDDNSVRKSLNRLESAYMVRRKVKEGQVYFVRNTLTPEEMDTREAFKQALSLLLGSTGPMTLDEVLIRLPAEQAEVEAALADLVESGKVVNDYITPVFSKQYILQSDLVTLESGDGNDANTGRIAWMSRTFVDVEAYFTELGYASDDWAIASRVSSYSDDGIRSLYESGMIRGGKIIKHHDSMVAHWLVRALHSLRYESPDKHLRTVVDAVIGGARSEKEIQEETGFEKQVARQLIRNAEFHCFIGRNLDSEIVPLIGFESPIEKAEAINMLVERYGPVSLLELSSNFWFYTEGLEEFVHAERNFIDGNTVFGKLKENKDKSSIIVSSQDPLSVYLRKEFRNSEYDYHFVLNGQIVGAFNVEIKEDSMFISDGFMAEGEASREFIGKIKSITKEGYFNTVVYNNAPETVVAAAEEAGITTSGNSISIGEIVLINLDLDGLVSYSIEKERRYRSNRDSVYDSLRSSAFGFSNPVEAYYSGISNVQIANYLKSRMIFSYRGPFGIPVSGTLESASMFRTLRERKLSENDQRVLRIIIESGYISEKEIVVGLRTNIFGISSTLKSLYSRSVIAKDFFRKFLFVPEKFRRKEAVDLVIRRLIGRFGFVDWERFSRFTGVETKEEFNQSIREFLKSGKVVKAAIHDGSKIVYATKDLAGFSGKSRGFRLISPREVTYLYLQDLIKAKFGTGSLYVIHSKHGLSAFRSKKLKKGIKESDILGPTEALADLKREMIRIGIR